jgi:hypothetical protein
MRRDWLGFELEFDNLHVGRAGLPMTDHRRCLGSACGRGERAKRDEPQLAGVGPREQ